MPWDPSPPQGFTSGQSQVIIGRPPIPLFGAPQGIGDAPAENLLLANFPLLGDTDFNRYKFYQVNKGEFAEAQSDFIWEITASVGPGVLQEASGFDIKPFGVGRSLTNAIVTGNSFDPELTINVFQLSDDELHLFGWEFSTGIIHEWVLSAPHVFPPTGTASDFQFSHPDTNGRDMKFILNGTKLVTVGVSNMTAEIYSLPTPNSLSSTPILEQTRDLTTLTDAPGASEFSSDGTNFYTISGDFDDVTQWESLSSHTLPLLADDPDRSFVFDPPITDSLGNLRILKDRLSMYLMSNTPDQISKYLFTDGFDNIPLTTKPPAEIFSTSSLDTNTRAMSLSKDESLLWFSGRQNNILQELELPLSASVVVDYEVTAVNVTTGDFTIKVRVPSIEDFTFIQIVFGNAAATDGSTTLGAGTALSTFETPLLTKDEDNFLVDNLGNNIEVVGQ
jgi:hypothetical protein